MSQAVLNTFPLERGLTFIEVEGELGDGPIKTRWFRLLRDAAERADGLAIDLRGCHAIDRHCVEALFAVSATLRARGGLGVALVALPGSVLRDHLCSVGGGDLPTYGSAGEAMTVLRAALA